MNLRGRRIHIVGSADRETDEGKLVYISFPGVKITIALAT